MTSHDLLPPADALPMLDPAMLDASAATAVHDILAEAASANTA
ncbi:hypothetical protein [Rhodanobacter thiooxydans]|nr:hypothetical protein [Rhodanobacter thiooxydans]MCW0203341.1 hypothetical protein [Rhodanobacter thiooxydans]